MDSLVASSAARLQTSRVAATLEQRQTLRSQIEAGQTRAQNVTNVQRAADRTAEVINETRFDRELIRATTDGQRIAAANVQEANDLRVLERQDRAVDDNSQTLDDELTREAVRDSFSPLPELQQNPRTAAAAQQEDIAPASTDEISLRELLVGRNARLTERAGDERSFIQQQTQNFERSVQAIDTFVTQPGDAATFEERGGIVDFQT